MFDESETEARLARLFRGPKGARAARAHELEAELLDAFDQRYPRKDRKRMKFFTLRRGMIMAAAAAVLGVVACTAEVDYDVEVGRTIDIRYDPATAGSPDPKEVASFIQATIDGDAKAKPDRGKSEVGLRVHREKDAVEINAEIWSKGPPGESIAARVEKAFPALSSGSVMENLLQGRVHGTIAKRIGHVVLDLDSDEDVNAARQKVMDQLAAQGIKGKVDVEIEGEHGEHRVMIKVERDCDGSAGCDEGVPPPLP